MTLIYHLFHCCVKDLLSILLMHHWMTLSWRVKATGTPRLKRILRRPRGNQLNYYCPFTKAKAGEIPRVRSPARVLCPVHCSGAPRLHEVFHLHTLRSAAPSALRSSARCSDTAASCLVGLPANEGECGAAGAGGTSWWSERKKKGREGRKERNLGGQGLLSRSVSSITLKRAPALGKGYLFHTTNAGKITPL